MLLVTVPKAFQGAYQAETQAVVPGALQEVYQVEAQAVAPKGVLAGVLIINTRN